MSYKLWWTGLLCAAVLLTACKEDKPEACVVWEGQEVLPYEVISFDNCSENAEAFLWDFGDGTTSTEQSPEKSYTSPGTYTVTLTVEDGASHNEYTFTVNVGTYALDAVVLNSIAETRPNGNPWDDDSSRPDVLLRYVVDSLEVGPLTNFSNDSLPRTFDVDNITADTAEIWTVSLLEQDAFIREQMTSWSFEVYQAALTRDSIVLENGDYNVVLRLVRN